MKQKVVAYIVTLVVIIATCPWAVAISQGDLVTSIFDEARQEELRGYFHLQRLSEEPEHGPIECYSVSDSGRVAILTRPNVIFLGTLFGLRPDTVLVYDANGKYQFGFTVPENGPAAVTWDGDLVQFVRQKSGYFYSIDDSTSIVRIAWVDLNEYRSAFDRYYNSLLVYEREASGTRYRAYKDMGPLNLVLSYATKLVRLDSQGNETLLYESSSHVVPAFFLSIAVIVVFLAALIFTFIKKGVVSNIFQAINTPNTHVKNQYPPNRL